MTELCANQRSREGKQHLSVNGSGLSQEEARARIGGQVNHCTVRRRCSPQPKSANSWISSGANTTSTAGQELAIIKWRCGLHAVRMQRRNPLPRCLMNSYGAEPPKPD